MRRIVPAIAALLATLAAPAFAQEQAQPRTPERVQRRGEAAPPGWTQGARAWRIHVARCKERYRTYDPRTDSFLSIRGTRIRCTL